jgi:DNA-directed RNA polymerase subunit RPC12/RpoP
MFINEVNMNLICGCGASFEAKRKSKYAQCPACAARARKIRQDKWYGKQKLVAAPMQKAVERKVKRLFVVDDPLPLDKGGFKPGTEFLMDDWRDMVRLMTFTPGTILKDGQGRLYEFRLGKKEMMV